MNALLFGVLAVAVVVIAAAQVCMLVALLVTARQLQGLSRRLEQEVQPVSANLRAITKELATASALARTQVERADRLLADAAGRVEETLTMLQQLVVAPAREGRALLSAILGAAAAFRELRGTRRPRRPGSDDEDPLFIG